MFRFDRFDRNQMFLDEMAHFFACVRGEARPIVDLREGLRSMKLAAAAVASLASGRAEAIP